MTMRIEIDHEASIYRQCLYFVVQSVRIEVAEKFAVSTM